MTAIVRVAIIAVTVALFLGSTLNAFSGQKELAVLFALATPLGISAWGFARGGHYEAAVILLCGVLTIVVTLVLVINPRGVNDVAVTAYGGVVLTGALLLSRRAFFLLVGLVLVSASAAYLTDMYGLTGGRVGLRADWPQYLEFLVITGVFASLGRFSAEALMGDMGDAHRASMGDMVTGLPNRAGFMAQAEARLKLITPGVASVLVLADLDKFKRVNTVIGHRAGDGVLKEAARRLSEVAGAHVVGRIGDDEFAVLVHGLASDAECESFARRVHRALQFEFLGVSVRTAVGFARSPRDANGLEAMLLAAESSLLHAKEKDVEEERFAAASERI